MRRFWRHIRHAFLFASVWAVLLNGCSSWRMAAQPPDEAEPSKVRVTLTDGSSVEMKGAYARGDTLFGYGRSTGGTRPRVRWNREMAIPLQRIEGIEERYVDPGRTSMAILVGAFAALGVTALIIKESYSPVFGP